MCTYTYELQSVDTQIYAAVCCSVLQCVAVCCSVSLLQTLVLRGQPVNNLHKQSTAIHSNALQRTATHCNSLRHWDTLHDVAAHCNTLHRPVIHLQKHNPNAIVPNRSNGKTQHLQSTITKIHKIKKIIRPIAPVISRNVIATHTLDTKPKAKVRMPSFFKPQKKKNQSINQYDSHFIKCKAQGKMRIYEEKMQPTSWSTIEKLHVRMSVVIFSCKLNSDFVR